jgi:predicted membrane protein
LTLRRVNVEMGVGELKMDLRGTPKSDYSVSVRGGVGEATIYLPEGVGIDADVKGGIGGIHAPGLQKRDSRYFNDSYGHAKTNVHLDIRGGIGSINLIAN